MSSRITASGGVRATTGVFCVFDPGAVRPLFAPGTFDYKREAQDISMQESIRAYEDKAARGCLLLWWDSGARGFRGGRVLVRDFHTAETGVRNYTGYFQVASGVIRICESADAWARITGQEMYGVGFEVELPIGVYCLRIVELRSVSDENEQEDDAIRHHESIESLIKGAPLLSLDEDENDEDDPPIYLLEFERTRHTVPPAEGPTRTVWGPSWK